jgi:hypothetical protein
MRKIEKDCLEVISTHIALILNRLRIEYDYSFYDYIVSNEITYPSNHQLWVDSSIDYLNDVLKSQKSPVQFSKIEAILTEGQKCLKLTMRINIDQLFDEHEEGYLMPFNTMLHLETEVMDCASFYKNLNEFKMPITFSKVNGVNLIRKVPRNNIERLVRDIDFRNVIRLLTMNV